MPLDDYHRKRDFDRTPEPHGAAAPSSTGRLFVVHKHDASRLHYDLRLELDGVLLSWAVPKGPSLDPSEKRLAVRVEDHPIDYAEFEGTIPEGAYGGGTVMLWDRGTWALAEGTLDDLADGMLKFNLDGAKLQGAWMLVRVGGKKQPAGRDWLLIKERDGRTRPERSYSILDEMPRSVATGRTMREIASAPSDTWMTREAGGQGAGAFDPAALAGARPGSLPRTVDPPQPRACDTVPVGDDWLHEILLPGHRLVAILQPQRVILQGADGTSWTPRLPALARSIARLPVRTAVLDGQIVVLRADGSSDLEQLDAVLASRDRAPVTYRIFDLPFCEGVDLTAVSLQDRKALLHAVLEKTAGADASLQFSDHIVGQGPDVQEHGRRLGVGTVLSKPLASPYAGAAQSAWTAFPCGLTPEPSAAAEGPPPRTGVVVQPGLHLGGVRFTNPDRVYYPDEKITKRDLALYYEQVAGLALPHLGGRSMSLVRCPKGIENERFYQKHLEDVELEHIRHVQVPRKEGSAEPELTLVIDDLAGLMSCVQLAALEIHPWGSRVDQPERPDRMIFDLDPGPRVTWSAVIRAAEDVRDVLAELGLAGFVKTSGGKGLHVVVPLVRRQTWLDVKVFSRAISNELVRRNPQAYTATISKSARPGRIFIDYLRNIRGATCVGAYSTRARPGAPVSTPLAWDELGGLTTPAAYTVDNFARRLASLAGDPWAGFSECRQSLTAAMRRALGIREH